MGARPSHERNCRVGFPERVFRPGAISLPDRAAESDGAVLAQLALICVSGVLGQVGRDADLVQRCLEPGQHCRPFPDEQYAIGHRVIDLRACSHNVFAVRHVHGSCSFLPDLSQGPQASLAHLAVVRSRGVQRYLVSCSGGEFVLMDESAE
jgi:hypothetical protein